MKRAQTLLYWTLPSIFCLAVYWPGLRAWFQQDDFAWLGLYLSVHRVSELLHALFAPMAQGTIRPLSERAFFLTFHGLFGMDAAPYRAFVFLTQIANLLLLGAIARRVTGWKAAGWLAPLLWAANSGLAIALSWTSAYNQILCAFFVLAAFYSMLRYFDTDDKRWLAGEWLAFVGGLASLETAIVFPVLAGVYTWFCYRRRFRSTLPFLAGAAAYGGLHYFVAPPESSDPAYVLHFDSSMARTLWTYWKTALGPADLRQHFDSLPAFVTRASTLVLSLGAAGIAVWAVRRKQWIGVVGLAWFFVALLPMLPLRDHVMPYALTLPAVGLALAGAAVLAAPSVDRRWRYVAAALAAVYLVCGAIGGRIAAQAVAARSWTVRQMVLGVYRARTLHPGKMIVLAGVDSALFWRGIFDRPFRALGISDVYLEPQSEARIEAHPEWGEVSDFVIPAEVLRSALDRGEAVVYTVEPRGLRGATAAYRAKARRELTNPEEPSRIDVGATIFARQLGPTWWGIDHGQRWIPEAATVRLRGPSSSEERLWIAGWCPPEQVASRPLRVQVAMESTEVGTVLLRMPGEFRSSFTVPAGLVGRPSVEVEVRVERTFRAEGDSRDLGLVFGSFEIKK